MSDITISLGEDGTIDMDALPEPIKGAFQQHVNQAYRKGAEKVERELKGRIVDPAERERIKLIEDENARFKEEKALADKNYEEARRLQEERLARVAAEKDDHIKAKDAEIVRRDMRLRNMLGAEIRAAAVAAGARDESLPELTKLLGSDLDLDADLNPFVKGADGKPLEKDGKTVSIEGFVTQYLADHPHHLKGSRGVPGRSTDGASFRRPTATVAEAQHEDAIAAVASNPTTRTIAGAVRSIRQRASA